ncbi:MAG: acyl-CoA synthetase (AMP-forming)/AMP-acid ligase II [Halioglobus sp.]|jgi:acyl-CoA synthetase (AMP-forming)/AMP-acid ligase II
MSQQAYQARTLPQIVTDAALAYGERVAISDGEVQLTYLQLDEARIDSARAFINAGLAPGDRIAIWAPNVYQWIIAAIGAQSIGGVLVPLNTRYKGAEAAYVINASGAKMVFTVGDFLGVSYPDMLVDQSLPTVERIVTLTGQAQSCETWEAFLASGASVSTEQVHARANAVTPEDTLDILFTSGTTGNPKGVVTCHGQNIRTFETWSGTVGLRSDDNYLIINPFFHSFGYKAGWLAAIIRGARILPVLNFDLDSVLAQIEREKISMIPGPPTIYQSLLAHPKRDDYDLSSLRLAVTGAAPVPVELVRQMREELGFEVVVTAYGLTESCGVVSICKPDDSAERISHSSGCAMDGTQIKCVDKEGNTVAADTDGEIWARGFNVMKQYFNNEEATAETLTHDGWLKTGDVGVMDKDGYVRITGRIKEMFIVGGFNCYPAEIENILCDMPGIARAAVIGVPDDRMGEVAKAYLVTDAGASVDEAAVIDWSRGQMANFKAPRSVVFLQELPMNAGGKVDKAALGKLSIGDAR